MSLAATKDRRPALLLISALVVLLEAESELELDRLERILSLGGMREVEEWHCRVGLTIEKTHGEGMVLDRHWVLFLGVGRSFSLTSVALALIFGGALGNLYDRIRYHHVVDFLAVKIVRYNYPDFNVADSCIVIGACLLLIEIFRPQPTDS